jgi:hypothetical protein
MSLVICSYHEPAESIPHPSVLLSLSTYAFIFSTQPHKNNFPTPSILEHAQSHPMQLKIQLLHTLSEHRYRRSFRHLPGSQVSAVSDKKLEGTSMGCPSRVCLSSHIERISDKGKDHPITYHMRHRGGWIIRSSTHSPSALDGGEQSNAPPRPLYSRERPRYQLQRLLGEYGEQRISCTQKGSNPRPSSL